MKLPRNPESVHQPLAAYSHQVEILGPERMLAMAGQIGMRPDGSVPQEPIAQLQVALENIERNLDAASMSKTDLFKLQLFVAGDMDAAERRTTLEAWLGNLRPCVTLVFVQALAAPDLRVEIDAWASSAS